MLVHDGSGAIRFERIPVLSEHISIPPHDEVTSAKHSYSFNESGSDLCFHSPLELPDTASTLAQFLKSVSDDFLRDGGKITPDEANFALQRLWGYETPDSQIVPEKHDLGGDDPIANWFSWGDMLQRDFGIEQYAFVSWDEL